MVSGSGFRVRGLMGSIECEVKGLPATMGGLDGSGGIFDAAGAAVSGRACRGGGRADARGGGGGHSVRCV